jgi:hypothetical protein
VLNSISTANSVTTGVSLSHTQSFNELKDLWRAARKRRKKETDENPNTDEEATKKENDGGQ